MQMIIIFTHPIFWEEIKIKLENDLKAIVICLNYYYSKSTQAKILKSYHSGGVYYKQKTYSPNYVNDSH